MSLFQRVNSKLWRSPCGKWDIRWVSKDQWQVLEMGNPSGDMRFFTTLDRAKTFITKMIWEEAP